MDGRSATVAAVAVALIGIAGFFLLDGVAAGLIVLVAGLLLVVIGLVGWRDREPALAVTTTGTADVGPVALDDGTDPATGAVSAPADAHDGSDLLTGVPLDEATDPDGPAPVAEEAPAPHPIVGEGEAVADPLGRGETDSVLDVEPDAGDAPDRDYAPAPEPMMQALGEASSLDHVHDEPLLGHSELVAHVRDYHHDLAQVGSTIQLRLLHERAHGAPHEPPVNLRTG